MSVDSHPSAATPVGVSSAVDGSVGTAGTGWPICSVEVRSPTVLRRHAEMLGAVTPNRSSRNRSCEVWSKTSEATWPPRLNGETTSIGTRTPSPMGPATPCASAGSGLDREELPRRSRRGHRRSHVVEEPVVLVVHDEQHRLGPHLLVRHQRGEHLVDEPGPERRGRRRMLVVAQRRNDPGDLGQRAAPDVGGEVVWEDRGEGLLVQRRGGVEYWEKYGRMASDTSITSGEVTR